jgi:predicted  nucleic acid-binding Zn-ribbon protein
MKEIKILMVVFMIFGMMVPLAADNGQISQVKAKQSGEEHTDVADDDEREKKNNGQISQVKVKQSGEEHINVADDDEREKKNNDQLG